MLNNQRLTFNKAERLRHRSLVEGVYASGRSLYAFPFRVLWRTMTYDELDANFRSHVPEGIGRLQLMITIPKKRRRHAVDRVLLRRRVRDAYRHERAALREAVDARTDLRTVAVSVIYIADKNIDYATIRRKLAKLLGNIAAELRKGADR